MQNNFEMFYEDCITFIYCKIQSKGKGYNGGTNTQLFFSILRVSVDKTSLTGQITWFPPFACKRIFFSLKNVVGKWRGKNLKGQIRTKKKQQGQEGRKMLTIWKIRGYDKG